MVEKVIVVSSDSHAGMPKELWTTYLESRFHDLLPGLRKDNELYPLAIALLGSKHQFGVYPEHEEIHRTGWQGLYDPVLRMADMDREGVAAELMYLGDNSSRGPVQQRDGQGVLLRGVGGRRQGPGTGGRPTTSGSLSTGSS